MKTLIIIAPISLHKNVNFTLKSSQKVSRRVVKLQTHWHWTQTKSTMTMFVMNRCTALMCNEIWWTMIMQIKILHNNFFMFYKMVLNIYFHKYFQWSLVDDKNTMLSFIIYAIKHASALLTWKRHCLESWANRTFKVESIIIQH